ncbi:hypothetical protein D0T53_01295 [Dysgonomonas sp. 216]|uniref:PG1828 family lipoprotein n=1 Tax=Dysgonomonas sp. 216 TaxID=2302934 RepID=UPI0013D22334|nr:hypothetical protein [Dysgonomonas sp. 216]NDW17549.1 hypothetical protein [Dysgonomonas sp. 216]
MKKLVLFAAVAVAISFASCSNKANTDATAPEADTTAVVETVETVEEVAAPADSAAVEVVEETVAE